MKVFAVLLSGLTLVGLPSCQEREGPTTPFNVQLLFEHDGCKVYRFIDGTSHYYANCNGSATPLEK